MNHDDAMARSVNVTKSNHCPFPVRIDTTMRLDLDLKLNSMDAQTEKGWINVRFGDGQLIRLPIMDDARVCNVTAANALAAEVCEKQTSERLAS